LITCQTTTTATTTTTTTTATLVGRYQFTTEVVNSPANYLQCETCYSIPFLPSCFQA
jgi:hypothetical protein